MTVKKALEELLRLNLNNIEKLFKNIKSQKGLCYYLIYAYEKLILIDNKGNVYMYKNESDLKLDLDYESQKNFMLEYLSSLYTYVADEDTFNKVKNDAEFNNRELKEGYLSVNYIDNAMMLFSDDIKNLKDLPQISCKKIKIYVEPKLKEPLKNAPIEIIFDEEDKNNVERVTD